MSSRPRPQPRKILAIINPSAARGRRSDPADTLTAAAGPEMEIQIAHTESKGDAERLACGFAASASAHDRIIAVGGDGTVHEVVNGIMRAQIEQPTPLTPTLSQRERGPTLAVIPTGTGNDFAYAAGIPTDRDKAIDIALHGTACAIDIATIELQKANGETTFRGGWVNCVGTLLDGAINMESHRLTKPKGFLLYLTAAIRSMIHHYAPANITIDVDGDITTTRAILLTISNAPRTGGGFFLAPDARLDDGTLTITAIAPMSRLRMFTLLPRLINKTIAASPLVTHTTACSITITFDRPTPIQVDGELLATPEDNITQITIKCLPSALQVACPPG